MSRYILETRRFGPTGAAEGAQNLGGGIVVFSIEVQCDLS